MKKNPTPSNSSKKDSNSRKKNANLDHSFSSMKVITDELNNQISLLSYEESLKALDDLLDLLQNDTVPVEDLQRSYLLGNLYLDHCEEILNNTEQEIVELNQDQLQKITQK